MLLLMLLLILWLRRFNRCKAIDQLLQPTITSPGITALVLFECWPPLWGMFAQEHINTLPKNQTQIHTLNQPLNNAN
uniref:Putative secreted protein n=1 Tax=Anopheles marajoara TaxID=58244 RepID=A0A2M4CCV5_9DIPT